MIRITAGGHQFLAKFEEKRAPKTCAAFREILPFNQKLIHARWSGEACWIPLGEKGLDVGYENASSRPKPGQILFHPPGKSEAEILFVYGVSRFRSKLGTLRGNHFLTIQAGRPLLAKLGQKVLYDGAQKILFEEAP